MVRGRGHIYTCGLCVCCAWCAVSPAVTRLLGIPQCRRVVVPLGTRQGPARLCACLKGWVAAAPSSCLPLMQARPAALPPPWPLLLVGAADGLSETLHAAETQSSSDTRLSIGRERGAGHSRQPDVLSPPRRCATAQALFSCSISISLALVPVPCLERRDDNAPACHFCTRVAGHGTAAGPSFSRARRRRRSSSSSSRSCSEE